MRPDFWARDVTRHIQALRAAMRQDESFLPEDLTRDRSTDGARELTQRLALKFGQLLCWWPAMVETARELRDRGNRLAVESGGGRRADRSSAVRRSCRCYEDTVTRIKHPVSASR